MQGVHRKLTSTPTLIDIATFLENIDWRGALMVVVTFTTLIAVWYYNALQLYKK